MFINDFTLWSFSNLIFIIFSTFLSAVPWIFRSSFFSLFNSGSSKRPSSHLPFTPHWHKILARTNNWRWRRRWRGGCGSKNKIKNVYIKASERGKKFSVHYVSYCYTFFRSVVDVVAIDWKLNVKMEGKSFFSSLSLFLPLNLLSDDNWEASEALFSVVFV